ncbi:translocation/assembly module TamB domain-containing protein [Pseudogemmobacter blasticus]|uniref:Translocation and assembly module protein TamB n=1 Tax=Fuscovulum blasticum DSM 2131 TaxID=1188250 RepID=A0A2T4JF28_FUSBL|nr:translocation/assembly module TamB domain-containing protein [Fuscovulum blasticum]PTE16525.1 translocation and assembly module protein TamB [Fuscovulum blasticum DSM 2131]
MRGVFLSCILITSAGIAAAQEDDRGYLTAFLEDNLSSAGRKVTITGFAGALSSQATVQRIEISDDKGIWITLDGVVLDWSRSSLLAGRVEVNALTAEKIVLQRWPASDEESLPSPEAKGFSLPELPVSVKVGEIAARELVLGPDILGEPVEGVVSASVELAGGEGDISVTIERTDDGPDGKVTLTAGYANATGQLDVALAAVEDKGGIAAKLLGLPGEPAVGLTLDGTGTLDDFNASFRLESDGAPRLSGPITIKATEDGARDFAAQLQGNPAPLFVPEYAEFLGDRVALDVSGTTFPTGRLLLDQLHLTARALDLRGSLALADDGLPQAFDLTGQLGLPDRSPVALPLPGEGVTRVAAADLSLKFDAATGNLWTAQITVDGLDQPDFSATQATLSGEGRIERTAGKGGVDGTLDFRLTGAAPRDPAVAQAMGANLGGKLAFSWVEGADALSLPQLSVTGEGYDLTGALQMEGLSEGLRTSGTVKATLADFGRLSGLAGRPLGGSGTLQLEGQASALSGAFDAVIAATTRGLKVGQPEADRLMAGDATLTASILRDETGTHLRAMDFGAASVKASASGELSSQTSTLKGRVDIGSLADIRPSLGGSLSAEGTFAGDASNAALTLTGDARGLRIGQPEVDRVLAGETRLTAAARLVDGAPRLDNLDLAGQSLTLTARSEGNGPRLRVDGRLRDLALLVAQFPGPVSVTGSLEPRGTDQVVDLRVTGPGGINTRVAGTAGARADLTLQGTAQAGVANGFIDPVSVDGALSYDLRLNGAWGLSALSGRATLSGGKLAIPARGLSLNRLAVAADLGNGRVRLTATGEGPRGGRLRVDGPVGLTSPYPGDLTVQIDGLRLRDPELYETIVSGGLTLNGPLMGRARLAGEVNVGETELRVPSTGFATAAELEAVRHVNDPAPVRATRSRAGVGAAGSGGGSSASGGGMPDWALDLIISAPSRIFLRGRGLDAELGGTLRLGGSLRAIVPSGGLDLIRGRLDILGKRLVLTEASLAMEGDFIPFLKVSASNETDGVTSTVSIEGPANEPVVTFSSSPELPQEEVLSWLLFGRGLDTLSAFQAAQLANAVAVLAGRGGEGLVGKLRKSFGFDDLDVGTDDSGSVSVKAGKYISKNVYTEIDLGQDGNSRINLNLDVKPGVTIKGRVDSDGDSGVGVYFEKDY